MVVLGNGQPKYEELMKRLRREHPQKFAVALEFNDPLAHLIEAGSDFFLMPSRYEPCGLNQMYSLRYGTVPIVRATGGLADTVREYDPETGRGNGFVFEDYDPAALLSAIKRGLALYQKKRPWKKLVTDVMRIDHSWASAAEKYVQAYERVQAKRAAA
jgi:starch synthase